MKIILSRKGFDSANGGCPSPIMPDGTLLSMPIPSQDDTGYEDLYFNGTSYAELLRQLNPKKAYDTCHLDPDLRENLRKTPVRGWKPAFGQIGAAQGLLANAKVEAGDVFLFFGWFHQAEQVEGRYRFVRKNPNDFYRSADLHMIYGYLQIGGIITDQSRIASYGWHPHASAERFQAANNTLYVPTDRLSFLPDRKGYGVLDYREDRVLTMKGQNRGTWKEQDFLLPCHVYGNRKNAAKDNGLYYSGIWQELVVLESDGLIDWIKSILE